MSLPGAQSGFVGDSPSLALDNILPIVCVFQNGADVNIVNDVGDSALHRAAYTGRVVSNVMYWLLKADRPRDYPRKFSDYRHTDKVV